MARKWGIHGFSYVQSTQAERDAFEQTHHCRPYLNRVRCNACGKRLWASGMGIGSHRRACTGQETK